jgi:hypothetical protein
LRSIMNYPNKRSNKRDEYEIDDKSNLFTPDDRDYLNLMNGLDEFSDESLFGEDKLEDLLEKKSSFLRGNSMMGDPTLLRNNSS